MIDMAYSSASQGGLGLGWSWILGKIWGFRLTRRKLDRGKVIEAECLCRVSASPFPLPRPVTADAVRQAVQRSSLSQ